MKRALTLLLTAVVALFIACEPNDWLAGLVPPSGNEDGTETPTPETPTPEVPKPENPEPENPAPAEITATLTYEECTDCILGYNKPQSYTNSYGTWAICAYNSKSIQINKNNVAYIGTPTFEGDIREVKLTFENGTRSGKIYLCTEKGNTNASGVFEEFNFSGTASERTLTTSGIKSLYIRSSACAQIVKVEIVAGGNGGGTTPNPEPENPTPEPEPEPTPTPNPGTGTATENWLELPAADNGVLYPNAEQVTITSSGERNYTILYDKLTYTSMWVAYPLESKHMGSYSRPGSWSFNPLIETKYQVDLCSHSYASDYSRGHLIPNGSRNGIQAMQRQTFYVTNSVPQIQNNFNGGIWNNLENALQNIAKNEKIYIVTGVLFSKVGESKTIKYTKAKDDTKDVPVPNYFYKVALKVTTNGSGVVTSASTIGFWFEHKTYSGSYTNYAVSVDQIEQWTGFDFFPNLPDNVELSVESNSSWNSFQSF
ncbi:MAG: DNA/RNA non-specific endonuclease [Alistipes sp.]|nr:DNA/RNA non-specific endonuclease [Alistipes sp.]